MKADSAKIAGLKARIAAAELQRSAWRRVATQEKYLEACSLVDALELELAQLERAERAGPGA
jgi:hypothetical protein